MFALSLPNGADRQQKTHIKCVFFKKPLIDAYSNYYEKV